MAFQMPEVRKIEVVKETEDAIIILSELAGAHGRLSMKKPLRRKWREFRNAEGKLTHIQLIIPRVNDGV